MDRKRNPVAVYDVEQPAVPHITAVFDTKACTDPKKQIHYQPSNPVIDPQCFTAKDWPSDHIAELQYTTRSDVFVC